MNIIKKISRYYTKDSLRIEKNNEDFLKKARKKASVNEKVKIDSEIKKSRQEQRRLKSELKRLSI